jgi:hypothetical protein
MSKLTQEEHIKFEAMDRTFILVKNLECSLLDHQGLGSNQKELFQKAFDSLGELYQSLADDVFK